MTLALDIAVLFALCFGPVVILGIVEKGLLYWNQRRFDR